jgi:pheromone shutdown protein TraB
MKESTRDDSSQVRAENQQHQFTEQSIVPSTTSVCNQKTNLWKSSLPEPLCNKNAQTLQKLCMPGCIDIYILGTAHISNDSSAHVQKLLLHLQPDCIFLELCDSRLPLLGNNIPYLNSTTTTAIAAEDAQNTIKHTVTWKERLLQLRYRSNGSNNTINDENLPGAGTGNWFQTMSSVLLTSVQEDYAAQLGVELGGEFRCAYQYWYNQQQTQQRQQIQSTMDAMVGIYPQRSPPHLILGDRPVQLTLIRAWESLSWWARIKVCIGLLWSSMPWGKPSTEELRAWLVSVMQNDRSDILSQSLEELRRSFPTLHTTIIAERDAWLAAKLFQTSQALMVHGPQLPMISGSRKRQTIVAVVGAGHVPGIVQWLTTPTTNTTEQILAELVTTKRWANDIVVQQEMIPTWINDVVEVDSNLVAIQE